MAKKAKENREQAFRMRLARKTFIEIGNELGVSTKTLSRWENGWADKAGREHKGWRAELETAWREKIEETPEYGIIMHEERLKTIQELARMSMAKLKEIFPLIKGARLADAKGLIAEIRELVKLAAIEKGELPHGPSTVVAIRNDISLHELTERYKQANIVPQVTQAPREVPEQTDKDNEPDDQARAG